MLTIGITGHCGFLGWHLRCRLNAEKDVRIAGLGRSGFSDPSVLRDFAATSNPIVHLAGMNRGSDADIEKVNLDLTRRLIDACTSASVAPHVIFANSTHADRDTAYGRSKRQSASLLQDWAGRTGATFTNVIIPNVFGEGGRPFYNSAVSTFCHQLSVGENPQVIEDREIEFVHAQTVCAEILDCARSVTGGERRVTGRSLLVSSLIQKLQEMNSAYRNDLIPDVTDPFDLSLFNTLRSYFFPKHYPVSVRLHSDARGTLFEAVKTVHGGQCFLSTTRPGITRGNHYHSAKIERFMVVQGRARIRLRKLYSSEVEEFLVGGDSPQYIDIPTFHSHNITNVGDQDLLTLFWSHEVFDPNQPDTMSEQV